MSRLESGKTKEFNLKKENKNSKSSKFEFVIKENNSERMKALPKEKRQEAIEEFDRETAPKKQAKPRHSTSSDSAQIAEYLTNASLLIKSGDFKLAQNLFRTVLNQEPYHPIAAQGMAQTHLALNEFEAAEKCYKTLLEVDPHPENKIHLGDAFYSAGRDHAALQCYTEALNEIQNDTPLLFNAYKNLGNIYVRSGDYDSAEENYNRAYTMNPDSDTLLVNYGTLEIQRGQLDKGIKHFRHAVNINAKNDRAWVGLALIHREYSDNNLAWGNLEKALDINPNNDTALRLIVDWAFRDNQVSRVINRFETYMDGNGMDVEISYILAKLLYCSRRFKQAKLEITRVLALDPQMEGAENLLKTINEELS